MSDFRIEFKIKNNRILTEISNCGFSSPAEFCRACPEVNLTILYEFINFRKKPTFERNGEFLPTAMVLADVLGVSPYDLWTDEQAGMVVADNRRYIETDYKTMEAAINHSTPESILIESESDLSRAIDCAMHTLTRREREIITRCFGLDGPEETRSSVADSWEVSKERVRQIELKALRKLRHGSRSKYIKEVINHDPHSSYIKQHRKHCLQGNRPAR